jgi:hypothetical protein
VKIEGAGKGIRSRSGPPHRAFAWRSARQRIPAYLKPAAVAALREGRAVDGGAARERLEVAQEFGGHLKAAHPLASTREDAREYLVQVDDASKVKQAVRKLNACKEAVDAAFDKPPAELP